MRPQEAQVFGSGTTLMALEAGEVSGIDDYLCALSDPEMMDDIKAKLHDALVAGLNDAQVKSKLLELGFEIVGNTPEQFTAFQASEFARWKQVIEVGKITAD